jgi:acetylornithine deacetylase/succinyl-diaminopimelate desuccinylase-like protein
MYQMGTPPDPDPSMAEDPVRLLQTLVRFDTSNPPGRENSCIRWLERLLSAAGLETRVLADDPDRPNLYAELPGSGEAPPLLLYGHVDVVPVVEEAWSQPPFGGVVRNGCVWGRGTLDMKGGVVMLLCAVLRALQQGRTPAGDIQLLLVSDEEQGGEAGAGYVTREYPELFRRTAYAIGEFGGFSTEICGERCYPIQVSEKLSCVAELRFTGKGGHASLPRQGGALVDMARAVVALDRSRPPFSLTRPVRTVLESLADRLPPGAETEIRALCDSNRVAATLESLDGSVILEPMLRNTVAPTLADAGSAVNVHPETATLTLDCRLVPGQSPADLESDLRRMIPEDISYTCRTTTYGPTEAEPDLGLFDLLETVLAAQDPAGVPFPFVLFASTDARHLARVGVQSYGFLPMRLPDGFEFLELVHAADERIPVRSLEFGVEAMERLLERYR